MFHVVILDDDGAVCRKGRLPVLPERGWPIMAAVDGRTDPNDLDLIGYTSRIEIQMDSLLIRIFVSADPPRGLL